MAWRGDDQFPLILTSDGSMEVYPENQTSEFRVMLNSPIEIGDDDWEVCLQSINYPFTWANVGPSAKVFMKYYMDNRLGPRLVEFPDWQCENLKEVIDFMQAKINSHHAKHHDARLYVGVDELGRFKLESNSNEFDVGFSPNMMRLLGLNGHKYAKSLTMEEFEKRQVHRELIDKLFKKNVVFPLSTLREKVIKCESEQAFLQILQPYVSWQELNAIPEDELLRMRKKSGNESQAGLLELLMRDLYFLAMGPYIPSALRGVIPCSLNPVQRMFIYCNIIEPIGMNDKAVRLLKLVNTHGSAFKTVQEEFSHPMYLPVQKGKISMIEVLIADESGDPVPFQVGTAVLTLHFRKARRVWQR